MQDTTQVLQELAEALGTTVDYLWPVLVQQQFIQAMIDLFVWVPVCLGILVANGVFYYKRAQATKDNHGDLIRRDWHFVYALTAGLLALGAITALPFLVNEIIVNLLNPEYAALKDILSVFGGSS